MLGQPSSPQQAGFSFSETKSRTSYRFARGAARLYDGRRESESCEQVDAKRLDLGSDDVRRCGLAGATARRQRGRSRYERESTGCLPGSNPGRARSRSRLRCSRNRRRGSAPVAARWSGVRQRGHPLRSRRGAGRIPTEAHELLPDRVCLSGVAAAVAVLREQSVATSA